MNSNTFVQILQSGLRVSLGATTALVETLQDPQKREENLTQLKTQLSQRIAEWEEKGEITEQEARQFVETMMRQQSNPGYSSPTDTPSNAVTTPPTTAASPNVQLELEELTAQIAAMRAELEKLRNKGSDS